MNDSVLNVRHALAIDEFTRFYHQNLFAKTRDYQDVKQVWFAGAHSDIGGSYPLNESELAQVTLEWMIREATNKGLKFDPDKLPEVVPKIKNPTISIPAYDGKIHKSLSGFWWLGELLPKENRETKRTVPPMGLPRFMFLGPTGASIRPTIHQTVLDRINDPALNYKPKNLVEHAQFKAKNYDIEQ